MIPMKLSEIAVITGGILHGDDALVTGSVEYDSRNVTDVKRRRDFRAQSRRRGTRGKIRSERNRGAGRACSPADD